MRGRAMTRFVKHALAAGCLIGALTLAAKDVPAADLVVVEARGGAAQQPGQTVDGTKVLALQAGQRLTLIAADGKVIRLTGPYDQAPAAIVTADANGLTDSLRNLVRSRSADVGSLGTVRSAGEQKPLPEPWLIDV